MYKPLHLLVAWICCLAFSNYVCSEEPPETGKIFDPFFTTKAGQAGTGLGLSTSKRLISKQHGRLQLQSNMKTGTCFEITLPTAEIEIVDDSPDSIATGTCSDVSGKKTVLVVDDEDAIRKVSSLILDQQGFGVLTAVNGESALAVLRTEHQRIDVVLLDLTMPGMSGMRVLEIVNQQYPDLPVILCSGYLAGVEDELGGKYHTLAKPFSAAKLITSISETLESSSELTGRADH